MWLAVHVTSYGCKHSRGGHPGELYYMLPTKIIGSRLLKLMLRNDPRINSSLENLHEPPILQVRSSNEI